MLRQAIPRTQFHDNLEYKQNHITYPWPTTASKAVRRRNDANVCAAIILREDPSIEALNLTESS